ncbi:hypothetical protein BC831DRAFT_460068 [Entophlyctis helioformis]|nr:hypothetical protein BC831DRAFT_460068 [Entophlyctis helioformis]
MTPTGTTPHAREGAAASQEPLDGSRTLRSHHRSVGFLLTDDGSHDDPATDGDDGNLQTSHAGGSADGNLAGKSTGSLATIEQLQKNTRRTGSSTFLTMKMESDSEDGDSDEEGHGMSDHRVVHVSDVGVGPEAVVGHSRPESSGFTSFGSPPYDSNSVPRRSEVTTADTLIGPGAAGGSAGGSGAGGADASAGQGGQAYPFARRFKYSAAVTGSPGSVRGYSSRPTTGANGENGDTRPTSGIVSRDPADFPALQYVNDAILTMSERIATDPKAAPTFTRLDLAEIIERVLDRFGVPMPEPVPSAPSAPSANATATSPAQQPSSTAAAATAATTDADASRAQLQPQSTPASQPAAAAIAAPPPAKTVHIGLSLGFGKGMTMGQALASADNNDVMPNGYSKATTIQAMEIKIHVQNQIIGELGRRVDRVQRHNTDLVEHNAVLIRERNIATQTREDLYIDADHGGLATDDAVVGGGTVVWDGRKLRPGAVQPNKRTIQHIEREFFDEEAIISSALAKLQAQMMAVSSHRSTDAPMDHDSTMGDAAESTGGAGFEKEPTRAVQDNAAVSAEPVDAATAVAKAIADRDIVPGGEFVIPDFHDRIDAEIIKYSADMLAIKKHFEPPSPVGIGLKHMADTYDMLKTNPYRDVRKGKPTKPSATNYHPQRLQQLVQQATDHIQAMTRLMTKQTHDLLNARTPEKYVQVLHQQLSEMTASLHECLDALAEEQRLAKRWRGQCEIMAKRLESVRQLFDKERFERAKFYGKRQACLNNLLPFTRAGGGGGSVGVGGGVGTGAGGLRNTNMAHLAWMQEEDLWKLLAMRESAGGFGGESARIAEAARAAALSAHTGNANPAITGDLAGSTSLVDASSAVGGNGTGGQAAASHSAGGISPSLLDEYDFGASGLSAAGATRGSPTDASNTSAPSTRMPTAHGPSPRVFSTPWSAHSDGPGGTSTDAATGTSAHTSRFVDVLAGAIDERALPPLPRRVHIIPHPHPQSRESRGQQRIQLTPEKVEIFIPSLRGGVVPGSFGSSRPGTIGGGISAFDNSPGSSRSILVRPSNVNGGGGGTGRADRTSPHRFKNTSLFSSAAASVARAR